MRVKCPIGSPATDQEVEGSLALKESILVAIRAKGPYAGSQQITANTAKNGRKNVNDSSHMPGGARHVLAISKLNN